MADSGEVGEQRLPVLLIDLCADRHLQHDILAAGAVAVLAHAVLAALRLEVLLVAVVDQRIEAIDRLDHHVAAFAAVAAVRAAELDELLAAKRHTAVSARAGRDINLGFIEEFHATFAFNALYSGEDPSFKMTFQNSAAARSANLAGIGMMLIGIFFFSLNDAMGKFLIATFSVGQILLIRSAAGLVMLTPFMRREGWAAFRDAPRPGIQVLRAVFLTFEVAAFYWALADMSLADVMTFYLAGPIYVTAMSPVLLGEQVGWRRWVAVGVGFI